MPTTEDIVTSIDTQLEELAREVAQLQGARAALIDGARVSAKPDRTRRRRRRTTRRQAGGQREVVLAGKLLSILGDHPGSSTAQLATLANGDPAQILVLLREAEAAGSVRRTGERRATRWHPHTEEDKIAERAAQLEKQRKSRARRKA